MSTKPPARRPAVWTGFLRRFTDERALDLQETMRLQRDVHSAWKKTAWAHPNAPVGLANYIFEFIGKHEDLPDSPHLRAALLSAITRVLERETAIFASADIDWKTAHLSIKDQVDLRRFLRAQNHFLANEDKVSNLLINTTAAAFAHILGAMPKVADTAATLSVPMAELLAEPPGDIIERITETLIDQGVADAGLFTDLLNTLYGNRCRASGFAPHEDTRKSVIPATRSSLPNSELLPAYLADTPFYDFFTTSVPFVIPREKYPEHSLIVAASGSGKTQYLQILVLNFLQEPDPPGMFILDSQDDEDGILHKLSRLQLFSDRLKDRLIILSPEDKPSLNLFAFTDDSAETDELFAYLAGAIDRELTAKMSTASAYILRLLRTIDAPTIHTFKDILETPKRYEKEIASLDQTDQDFFNNQFNVKSEMGATRLQVASRLYTILANRAFTDMFAARENRFDVYEAMRQKKIVLVNTSERKLGSAGSRIFGRYIVAQVMAAAMKRGDTSANRELSLLLLDEAHEYFDAQTEKILRQARKFNVGLVAATQMYDQTETKVKAALATNTATKMVGSVSHNDARDLAQEMFTTTEHIRAMKKGQFATYVRDLTSRAITLNVPFGAVEAEPQMSEDAYQEMRERNRAALSTHYTSIVSTDASNVRPPLPTVGIATTLAPSTTEAAPEFEIKPGKHW